MGYLFLFTAVFAGAAKGYFGKRTSAHLDGTHSAVVATLIRMLFCIAVGAVIVFATGEASQLLPDGKFLLICALSGAATAVFLASWLISIHSNAYMMVNIFLMLGVLIPLFGCDLCYGEAVRPVQWVGVALLFAALFLMYSYNKGFRAKISLASLLLLLLCGVAYGLADFSQKIFTKEFPQGSVAVFHFYTFLFAAGILAVLCLFTRKEKKENAVFPLKKVLWFIFAMALCLFLNAYLKTLASHHLSAVLLYPLSQGGSLILSTFMSAFLFREKITRKALCGIACAFAALLIINLA
ncbi:MAG: DMT family transporter [Clostridia bacterium]|nr:DMT family transporter [Clostridia bacterium]